MENRALILFFVLPLVACRPGLPCPSCDDDDAADDESPDDGEDIPDLPCGGADLQTDRYNCGTCGNSCLVEGSKAYETSGCVDGVCGPTWIGMQWLEPSLLTCDDVCLLSLGSCQAAACAGLTGLVCESIFFTGCAVMNGEGAPVTLVEVDGSCNEPIPWPEETQYGGDRLAYCCCG